VNGAEKIRLVKKLESEHQFIFDRQGTGNRCLCGIMTRDIARWELHVSVAVLDAGIEVGRQEKK
jgi:hypothetical protein